MNFEGNRMARIARVIVLSTLSIYLLSFTSAPLGHAARQQALAKELSRRSLTFLRGIGQHPSNEWPGEDSFLVFGLTLEAAKVLGSKFEQNGFVWNGADGVPQLILLR